MSTVSVVIGAAIDKRRQLNSTAAEFLLAKEVSMSLVLSWCARPLSVQYVQDGSPERPCQ